MIRRSIICLVASWLYLAIPARAQQFYFPAAYARDSNVLSTQVHHLAKAVLSHYRQQAVSYLYLNNLLRLQSLTADYSNANKTIQSLRRLAAQKQMPYPSVLLIQFELYNLASLQQVTQKAGFSKVYTQLMQQRLQQLDDTTAFYAATAFTTRNGTGELQQAVMRVLNQRQHPDSLNREEALTLCRSYHLLHVFQQIEKPARLVLKADDNRRYIIEDSVLIKTPDGATLSAVVVRNKKFVTPQPAVLFFNIYSDLDRWLYEAKQAAARGYTGIIGDTRGKRLSPDPIEPYEHEPEDVNTVIDWISKQAWCNGKVGMYGGSYSGYAQWAATKHLHPALKTIVPYVAAIPGMGLPMENNIFLNANYGWAFYVTNNRYLDNATYFDPQRWRTMQNKWFSSGVAYRRIDSVDGTPNPWLQRWLSHPSYDSYWQHMVPYKEEFAHINIPVLTIDGYYDDGQLSGLHYMRQHVKYNKQAEHYLIIGPYDHFGAQRGGTPVINGYTVDSVALINTAAITYQWLDYILRGGKKPAILQDRINYEVMGANEWRHAPSLEKMSDTLLTLYLTSIPHGGLHELSDSKPISQNFLTQEIDYADRTTFNNDYYPDPIIRQEVDTTNGLFFISQPFNEPVTVSGSFSGELKASINKKDMDIGVTLYEVMPDGRYFHLSYFLGRASYANDPATRQLLTPGKTETIPFSNTRLVSKQLSKGSRLLVMLNINKNSFAQVNYGTGKDVSDETIADATEPLRIKWYNDSFIRVPVKK